MNLYLLSFPQLPHFLLLCELNRCNEGNGHFIHVLDLQDEGAELPFTPPMRGELYAVRSGVRPKLQRSAIEVGVIFFFSI